MRLLLTSILLSLASLTAEPLTKLHALAGSNFSEIVKFRDHGALGEQAWEFLSAGMPESDLKSLSADLLIENFDYAMRARSEFAWSEGISEEMFFNDVLPYAILDETRESWRPEFYSLCKELVKDCQTAGEAAQVLNRDLFNKVNVHYNRGRKKPNQSPSESMQTGKATCTGLSIILAYGCRSVGVPARLAGTPLWSDKSGNHTWVEIWDGEWKYLGADEYDAKGLNRGWFGGRASKAQKDKWQHAIWATSWKGEAHFPMVWSVENKSVQAVNVTSRYTKTQPVSKKEEALAVRVFEEKGGSRLVAEVSLLDEEGKAKSSVTTKANRADMNDVARLPLSGKAPWHLLVKVGEREKLVVVKELPKQTFDVVFGKAVQADADPLDLAPVLAAWKKDGRAEREKELAEKVIRAADKEMRFLERKLGAEPEGGHSLWISMHGGGGAPAQVNDGQWRNQINLYSPQEGYYIAPRAPTNTWNLWHQPHIDPLFDRLIANYVICKGVNPNKIYLLGYSAGGDGVYQLAPRLADRFAAASMMAGHPGNVNPDNLRNLRFEIFMGEKDGAYKRNETAAKWKGLLAEKKEADPAGYSHRVTIYPGLGHWMDRKDAEVVPRMLKETRVEWPKKVVWVQSGVLHERFYWLGVTKKGAKKNRRLEGRVEGQHLAITGEDVTGLKLWLSDELLDLDKEVVVTLNGKEAFRGKVKRDAKVATESLKHRCGMIATALLELE